MSQQQFEIIAEARELKGTANSRRMRISGKVPAVIYGAGKENKSVMIDHNQIYHSLEKESFLASIVSVKTDNKTEDTIVRSVQMHPYKQQVLHVDFLRVDAKQEITLSVPLHISGAEEAAGVKLEGGILTQLITEIEVSCLPKDLPEYLEIDATELALHESLHISDIKLPAGVTMTAHGDEEDHAVASIVSPRIEVEEDDVEAPEGDEAADDDKDKDESKDDE